MMNKQSDIEKIRRKEKEFNFRRAEILSVAEKVFATNGFYSATVADIAHASGFAVGTLYQFFQSKEELYMTMVTEKMNLMYEEMRQAAGKMTDPVAKLRGLILFFLQFVESNLDFCNLFFRGEAAAVSEGGNSLRNRMVEEYIRQTGFIEGIIRQGVAQGVFVPCNARDLSFALFGMIRGVIFAWMLDAGNAPLTARESFILDIFLKGVSAKKEEKGNDP
ncbi:MAG: TetR/AcrR family transcriptional regulator [Syntrophales bacterium]|nr:TetR/AcrR family transcriptional regulator [Syntrophales bacterium]